MTQKRQRKQQQQIRLRLQRERQLLQQHKDTMMPLVKFLKKQGLPFKYAREGQNRIQYFRADDLNKFLQMEKVKSKIEGNQKVKSLVSKLQTEQCLLYYRRPADIKNLKYPPVLQRVHPSDPQARFCSFKFDTTISRKGLMFGILAGALALVLFPVWPFTVKYAIWLISLYLLIFLVGLLLFRLVVYMVCVVLGYNVWILPNLLGDYGFFQSFKPLIYAERWEKSWFNIAIRLGAFGLLTFYGVQLYLDPSFLQSHFTVTKSTIDDIHDWGVSKIKNQVKFSQRAITNLEDILNQTADVEDDTHIDGAGQKDGSETNQNVQEQEELHGQQSAQAQAQAQVQIEAQQKQAERQEQL